MSRNIVTLCFHFMFPSLYVMLLYVFFWINQTSLIRYRYTILPRIFWSIKWKTYNYRYRLIGSSELKAIKEYYGYERYIYNAIKRSYRRIHVRISADSCPPKTSKMYSNLLDRCKMIHIPNTIPSAKWQTIDISRLVGKHISKLPSARKINSAGG